MDASTSNIQSSQSMLQTMTTKLRLGLELVDTNSVIVWETCLGIWNKTGFLVVILDSKYSKNSKICEAEVTLTPLINKICKPWGP